MKLPDPQIPREKLTKYLLVPRPRDDKSKYLALAGFNLETVDALDTALLSLAAEGDASEQETTKWGVLYELRGSLTGPNGKGLAVVTIWMVQTSEQQARFVTLFPSRKD